jgi:hypothetical protein
MYRPRLTRFRVDLAAKKETNLRERGAQLALHERKMCSSRIGSAKHPDHRSVTPLPEYYRWRRRSRQSPTRPSNRPTIDRRRLGRRLPGAGRRYP